MTATVWTRRLQILVFACSLVFTAGTLLHGFVVMNPDTMEATMRLAGKPPAEAADAAPGFLTGFRIVGAIYAVGNALGMLALRGRAWVFWVALLVNATQAAGPFGMIPAEMFQAVSDAYGPAGLLPSLITDGGALMLTLVLLATLVRYRRPWALRRH
ncbi:hypothetical protein [Actinomadura sp. B10D3]|uniref:hypothetical protein n=1 Tax=Actinomadura sp. B10D3 TaxID=3153557 RepID=UPI00325EDBA6